MCPADLPSVLPAATYSPLSNQSSAVTGFLSSGLFAMIVGALSLSLGSACIKLAGARLPALEIVFARSFLMLFYCLLLIRRAGVAPWGRRRWFLLLRGVLGFASYVCNFYAVIHMPLADALVIIFSFPLIVPLWAGMFLDEKLEGRVVLCSMAGALGMLLVTKPPVLFGGGHELEALAVYAAVGAALLASFSVICIRKLTTTEHPLVIVFYAAALSAVGTPIMDAANWLVPTWTELGYLLGVGLFMSVGQHFVTIAFSRSTAGRASVLFYLEIVFAALLGFLLFDEIPDALTFAGAGCIIGGAMLLARRRRT